MKTKNKNFNNALMLFVLLAAIVAFKTKTEIVSFFATIIVLAGVITLIINLVFQKKGCEVCHNTIADFKDEDGKKLCLTCHNEEVAKQVKKVKAATE